MELALPDGTSVMLGSILELVSLLRVELSILALASVVYLAFRPFQLSTGSVRSSTRHEVGSKGVALYDDLLRPSTHGSASTGVVARHAHNSYSSCCIVCGTVVVVFAGVVASHALLSWLGFDGRLSADSLHLSPNRVSSLLADGFGDSSNGGAKEACVIGELDELEVTLPTADQLHIRLGCHRKLIEKLWASGGNATALDLPTKRFVAVAEALVMLCSKISRQMEQKQAPRVLLRALGDLEFPFRDAFAVFTLSTHFFRIASDKGDLLAGTHLDCLLSLRMVAREALLDAVQNARELEISARNRGHELCPPRSLTGLEDLALAEATAEDHPDTQFKLALYRSFVLVLDHTFTHCFRRPYATSRYLVHEFMQVEELLLHAAADSWDGIQTQRAIERSERLCTHAHFLAQQQLLSAAELRFRNCSSIYAALHMPLPASAALAELAIMYKQHSRHSEALEVAEQALALHSGNPLGLYIQASMRINLHKFADGIELQLIARQLGSVSGQLSSRKELEEERVALLLEIASWVAVAEGGIRFCIGLGDVGKILVCIASKLMFK